MAALNLPPVPPVLKPIQHYLKVANEHDRRDPVVSYWARLYSLQTGIRIDKSKESYAFLHPIMDWLEACKRSESSNEAITSEVVGQAHCENYALKLFLWADKEDRASHFNKNVVKAFYTAGMIFDICETFGELSDELINHRKYAKWKAAYIHNCLKNGETPLPGPINEDEDEVTLNVPTTDGQSSDPTSAFPTVPSYSQPSVLPTPPQPTVPSSPPYSQPTIPPAAPQPSVPSAPYSNPSFPPSQPVTQPYSAVPSTGGGMSGPKPSSSNVSLNFEQITKAQRYSKLAYSSLNYEDVPTAIENLQKALTLLTTGVDA